MALALVGCWTIPHAPGAAASPRVICEDGGAVASGAPDSDLLAREASAGIRAYWCEQYDSTGTATRLGPYREYYPNGRLRVSGQYVDSSLAGPVAIQNEDGTLFLRGYLDQGEWSGAFEIFHETGAIWFEAEFQMGRLEGPLRTHYPDGALESETQYQAGREDGLARSFYPTVAGGRLKSEAHVEADQIVGVHRLLSRDGELLQSIDWSEGPPTWRRTAGEPAAPGFFIVGESFPPTAPDPASHPTTSSTKSTTRD